MRDEKGHVIAAKCKIICASYVRTHHGEAIAALHAAKLYRNLGLFDVIPEMDSLTVAQAVAASKPS
jgi:hypothetical protein